MSHYLTDLLSGERTRADVLRDIAQSAEAAGWILQAPGVPNCVRDFKARRPRGDDAPRPLLFLHIMKCAGTTMTEALSRLAGPWPVLLNVYLDNLACLPQPMLQQAMLVTGHLPYEAVRLVDANTAVCTVFREPVDRTLSHFTHLRARGHDDLTLEQFVLDDRWRSIWHEHQARQLTAAVPVETVRRGQHPEPSDLLHLINTWPPPEPREILEQARRRLESIDFVGVTDDLQALLRQVAEFWRKPEPPSPGRHNGIADRLNHSTVPASLLDAIHDGTAVDAELYAMAKERSQAAIAPRRGGNSRAGALRTV